MENQTTAPEVQSEQSTDVVQNNTEATLVSENQETNFKDLIPEGFKEEKALDNFNNMEDFVKSYLHAQKLVGADKIPVPNKHATEEDWNEVFKKLKPALSISKELNPANAKPSWYHSSLKLLAAERAVKLIA